MSDTDQDPAGTDAAGESIWERLVREPLLEQTEPVQIKRSFVKRLFGGFYEHLGSLIVVNLAVLVQVAAGVGVGLLAGALMPVAWLGVLLLAAVVILFAGPAFAGLFNYTRCMNDDDERTSFSQYRVGMKTYAKRSWILLAGQAAVGGILFINFRFYGTVHSIASVPILLILVVLTLIWAMAGSYAWPLLVRGLEWRVLVRNAVFLALAAPVSTIVMLIGLIAVSALLIVTTVGAVAFFFPAWAVTENLCVTRLVGIFRARQEAYAAKESSPAQA